jgi:hypothetical protein
MGGGRWEVKGKWRVMERVEQTKVKYTHSMDTLRNPLNTDLNINNKRQDCKIGTVCGGGKSCGTGEDEWRRLR